MSKQNIEESVESRVCFEELEDWVREKIQGWVQELLEEEVTELLGRRKSERRRAVDAPSGYGNGYGKPRHLTLSSGTIQVRRPRVRDLEEHFESRVLPLFAKRTRQVRELIPELYLHGLALGDFDLALRGLLGEKPHLSSSTVARLKEKWQAEWEVWQSRPLNDLEVVYLWVDGIYVKAGLEKESQPEWYEPRPEPAVRPGLPPREGRKFALTVGSGFAVLGLIVWGAGNNGLGALLSGIGSVFILAGIVLPGRLTLLHQTWMELAKAISRVTIPITMSLVYLLIFAPLGGVRRLIGRNPLVYSAGIDGYWKDSDPEQNDRGNLERQF